jgi:hypothetical protein
MLLGAVGDGSRSAGDSAEFSIAHSRRSSKLKTGMLIELGP